MCVCMYCVCRGLSEGVRCVCVCVHVLCVYYFLQHVTFLVMTHVLFICKFVQTSCN